VLMRMTQKTFSAHRINLHYTKAFLFRKGFKQLRFDEGKEHVNDANFSSPLSAIIFSCKMKMERKKCVEQENDTTDIWCVVIDYLLSIALIIAVENHAHFPWEQSDDFH
jgi:hypothetical protein